MFFVLSCVASSRSHSHHNRRAARISPINQTDSRIIHHTTPLINHSYRIRNLARSVNPVKFASCSFHLLPIAGIFLRPLRLRCSEFEVVAPLSDAAVVRGSLPFLRLLAFLQTLLHLQLFIFELIVHQRFSFSSCLRLA